MASRHGYPNLGSFVLARIEQGASLAAISREAGLNKDWLSRHLGRVDPAAAEAVRHRRPHRLDARWLPALARLGFRDVASYLHERHIVQHWTVNAIAAEVGLTHHAVETALRRHGLARMAHAAKRHEATSAPRRSPPGSASAASPATSLTAGPRAGPGKPCPQECAQPPSWLRRQAQAACP